MASLEIRNLTFTYPLADKPALKDVSLTVDQAEFVVICGKSGCGKSTLLRQLKKNLIPVLVGCLAGVLVHFISVMVMSKLFGLEDALVLSLLPKSVTNPIATAISQEQGGVVSITVAAVIVAGMLGNLLAPFMVKVFRIKDPVATGLGIGACSHAVGTARAVEMGETEGALSGLAIGICGIITAVLALSYSLFF